MQEAGATVLVLQADVAERQEMVQLLATIEATMPPLRGIIHAAGVIDDGMLAQQAWSRFEKVMAPKVRGAWNLHQLTQDMALDFFILFSTSASVLGSSGQSNYVAANTFLDMLAHHRRALGLPALSINWGPWAEVGMAAGMSVADQQRFSRLGVERILPAQGIQLLEQLLEGGATQAAVLPINWSLNLRAGGNRKLPSWMAELANKAEQSLPRQRKRSGLKQESALTNHLAKVPQTKRQDALLQYLRDQTRAVLALDAQMPLDAAKSLSEYGLDSLLSVEMRNLLSQAVGQPLPVPLLYDYPTLDALADYIGSEVLHLEGEVEPERTVRDSSITRQVATNEAIAIVGTGMRFPGQVNDLDSFWHLLHNGVDAISMIPRDRWDFDAFFDPTPATPGKMSTRAGGFIKDVDRFDPHFFGITPREANQMDPQQRLLLEVSWEALEKAGYAPDRLKGSQTGVFIGISNSDYAHLVSDNPEIIDAYLATGISLSVAAGRVSYVLGLQGPNMAIDTACSSSLVALHLACQSLRSGESCLALAGGVNLILAPGGNISLSRKHDGWGRPLQDL